MPAHLAEGQDADDIAAYIAKCIGKADCGVTATNTKGGGDNGGGGGETTTPTETTAGGGGGTGEGKKIFASAGCNGCHTLKDAGASGAVGPNLDKLKPSQDQVAKQVANGGGGMPPYKGELSDEEIDAVSEYVSSVAGK